MIENVFRRYPILRIFYKGLVKQGLRLSGENDGLKVMEEDWDVLIVLDACRYDFFRDINWIEGSLEKKISLGSHTEEWMEKNFLGNFQDIVYISGNPYISEVKSKKKFDRVPFYRIEEVWDYGWDKESGLLPPESITKAAIEAKSKYPDKRMIVHYLQPHWPFPPTSKVSKSKIEKISLNPPKENIIWKFAEKLSSKFPDLALALESRRRKGGNVWAYLRRGAVEIEDAKLSYKENITSVLKEVERLLEELKGKVVITSDHGNLFGEHWIYGHPKGMHFKEIIEVPWLVVDRS